MRFICAALVLLLSSAVARADSDFMLGTGGTLYPLPGKNPDVRLVRERVHAVIYPDFCDTTAIFELHNSGPAQTVAMAFPETNDSYRYNKFQSFAMTLDSRSTKARRALRLLSGDETKQARWITRVPFGRGQRRTVRVRYRSGYEGLGHAGDFEYGFNSGGWRGMVGESSVTVTFAAPGTYLTQPYLTQDEVAEGRDAVNVRRNGRSLVFRRTNWQADEWRFILVFEPTFAPGWLDYKRIEPLAHSVTVPGKPTGVDGAGFWLPVALVRNGTTYVSLNELDQRLAGRKDNEARSAALDWEEKSKTATLRAGKHTFKFEAGRKTVRVNGRVVKLSAAPFIEEGFGHDSGNYSHFYVPLMPVLKVLGGTMNVNAKAHRFYFTGPLFRSPRKDD